MESNVESPCKLLCTACLCFGRTLQSLQEGKLRQCYMDMIKEIPIYNTPIQYPAICLECSTLLQKLVRFKQQVQDSYRILQAYTNETLTELLLTDITRPLKLKVHNLNSIDIQPSNVTDNVSLKHELKQESNLKEIGVDVDTSNTELPERGAEVQQNKRTDEHIKHTDSGAASEYFLVCVKDELKEDKEDETEIDATFHSDCPSDNENLGKADEQLNSKIDEEIQCLLTEMKTVKKAKFRKKKKKRKCEVGQKSSSDQEATKNTKILTIELTYEQMMAEREKDSNKDSYTRAEFKCENCIVGFNYKTSYMSHMTSKHSSNLGDFGCPICQTILPTVESFQAHYKRHMRRFECGICQKRTLDMKVMEQHYYSAHDISLKQYSCSLCAHVSNSIDLHRYHKDTHKARVQCPECEKTFTHRAGLMNHRLAVHELNNSFPCNLCDKVFRWKTSLKRHLEKHDAQAQDKSSTNAGRCETCKITFASECSYKRHMKNSLKHVTQDQLKYVCDHCSKRFADKTKLRDHIEEKHLFKTYQCHICLKPSKNRVGLDQHIRNVHKGRPNNKMCHHCGKGFPTKMQLESHIRTHTGERPFICEFCPTMFSQQSNLNKHNRQVHLNMKSKRYMCKKRHETPLEAQSTAFRVLEKKRKEESSVEVHDAYRVAAPLLQYSVSDAYCTV